MTITEIEYWDAAGRVETELLAIYCDSEEPEEIERDRKAVADAVNNEWREGLSEHDWLMAAARSLGCSLA
jgi:hypothetical protein